MRYLVPLRISPRVASAVVLTSTLLLACSDAPGPDQIDSDRSSVDGETGGDQPDAGGATDGATLDDASFDTLAADAGVADAEDDDGCSFGEAQSEATTGQLDLFGQVALFNGGEPIPAGEYEVRYVDGCMKYASYQDWAINARDNGNNTWWLVGETSGDRKMIIPATVGYTRDNGGFAEFEDCVAANKEIPSATYTHEGGKLGVWLADSPYSDNVAGLDGRNPRWRLVGKTTCATAE